MRGTGTSVSCSALHDAILAVDRVRALQQLARRLLAQHVAAAGARQQERRVRLARRRLLGRDRPLEARQPGLEVARQRHRIDLGGLMREGGHVRRVLVIRGACPRESSAEGQARRPDCTTAAWMAVPRDIP